MSLISLSSIFSSAIIPSIEICKIEPSTTSTGLSKDTNLIEKNITARIIKPEKNLGKNKIKLMKNFRKILK